MRWRSCMRRARPNAALPSSTLASWPAPDLTALAGIGAAGWGHSCCGTADAFHIPHRLLLLNAACATTRYSGRGDGAQGTLGAGVLRAGLEQRHKRAPRTSLGLTLDLLSRPLALGETQIVKPSNFANSLASEMLALRPDSTLVLSSSLKWFLCSGGLQAYGRAFAPWSPVRALDAARQRAHAGRTRPFESDRRASLADAGALSRNTGTASWPRPRAHARLRHADSRQGPRAVAPWCVFWPRCR